VVALVDEEEAALGSLTLDLPTLDERPILGADGDRPQPVRALRELGQQQEGVVLGGGAGGTHQRGRVVPDGVVVGVALLWAVERVDFGIVEVDAARSDLAGGVDAGPVRWLGASGVEHHVQCPRRARRHVADALGSPAGAGVDLPQAVAQPSLLRFIGVLVRPVVEVVHPLVAEQPRDRRTPVGVGGAAASHRIEVISRPGAVVAGGGVHGGCRRVEDLGPVPEEAGRDLACCDALPRGISKLQFHTNTAAICGDFKPRLSPEYPVSYRYYGAFCAADQEELDANQLSATPLYYGLWAFRQVPQGRFVDLDLDDSYLDESAPTASRARAAP